ncbi:MAG: hypothetical protein LBC75_01655 [Fibromonadaceae bacterium]|nr:hypothetical protein [Fibromonadaceae bacterium]
MISYRNTYTKIKSIALALCGVFLSCASKPDTDNEYSNVTTVLMATTSEIKISSRCLDASGKAVSCDPACDKVKYNSKTEFCYEGKIYLLCNGRSYSPPTRKCENGVVLIMCGTDYYDYEAQFCFNDKVYNRCKGEFYDPSTQKCENNVVFTICGTDYYNKATQFCFDDVVYEKCNGKCHDGSVNEKKIFVDSRDGQEYKTILIGTQTWLAENLNYNAEGSKCYDNDPDNCAKYGRLYNWETANKVCPQGWHLPSEREWKILVDYTGDADLGFTVLMGGCGRCMDYDKYYDIGQVCYLWGATKYRHENAFYLRIDYNFTPKENSAVKTCHFSVRCIKD